MKMSVKKSLEFDYPRPKGRGITPNSWLTPPRFLKHICKPFIPAAELRGILALFYKMNGGKSSLLIIIVSPLHSPHSLHFFICHRLRGLLNVNHLKKFFAHKHVGSDDVGKIWNVFSI
jgi:hypothetical protein